MDPLRTSLILGSTRAGRLCDKVAGWAAGVAARQPGLAIDRIDPLELDLPCRHDRHRHPGLVALRQRLGLADAFLVVTPEYNHGYPAALKFLIDSVQEPWHAKPVGFVSYGGISGGIRAVEQLRQVFAELHAVTLRNAVSLAHAWERFTPSGTLQDPEPAEAALAALLRQLDWWGRALRQARQERPYREVLG
ncbi:NADPH-dependent FMN reductase [Geminicoccus flavidas]|uniref:NADPH-dependent FMN reductase n=1 Tax=Geminicoccus flavidas TaxID=2506407 RepID=UPI00135769DC|nr:NAD(P)H-dependent oxidoreductase [Geminicoccus flavidas]